MQHSEITLPVDFLHLRLSNRKLSSQALAKALDARLLDATAITTWLLATLGTKVYKCTFTEARIPQHTFIVLLVCLRKLFS